MQEYHRAIGPFLRKFHCVIFPTRFPISVRPFVLQSNWGWLLYGFGYLCSEPRRASLLRHSGCLFTAEVDEPAVEPEPDSPPSPLVLLGRVTVAAGRDGVNSGSTLAAPSHFVLRVVAVFLAIDLVRD